MNARKTLDELPPSSGEAFRKPRVRICNPKHPHYGSMGRFTGEVISLFGKPMAKIELENSDLGDACYVSKGDIVEIPESKPTA